MVMTPSKANLSSKLIEALSNPIFPELDNQLRSGRHICTEDMEKHSFVHEYFSELDTFYRRYSVELIRAPEDFFYLRTKSTSIIASSQLTELEMMAGKILCLLYLSPERVAQQGVFTPQEVYEELTSLVEVERLVKLINPRSTGSDLDKAKLMEKLRSALGRLARMGVISYRDKERKKFLIRSSCFRFGAEVRSGDDSLAEQEKLIRSGEAVTKESLKEQEKAQAALEAVQDQVQQQQIHEQQQEQQAQATIAAIHATSLTNSTTNSEINNQNSHTSDPNQDNTDDKTVNLLQALDSKQQASASHFEDEDKQGWAVDEDNAQSSYDEEADLDEYEDADLDEYDEEDLDEYYDEDEENEFEYDDEDLDEEDEECDDLEDDVTTK